MSANIESRPLPKVELPKNRKSERQSTRQRQNEIARAVHWIFLPAGVPPKGILDVSDRKTVNINKIPLGRLIPIRSFYYPESVLAHETTSRQIFESGIFEPDDPGCPSVVDTFQVAAAQVNELVEAYGNQDYGYGLSCITSLTEIEDVSEIIEHLIFPKVPKTFIEIVEHLRGAEERVKNSPLGMHTKECALAAIVELKEACQREEPRIRGRCESAINEVESARSGHEGKKQLDQSDRYWFAQLGLRPPREELFSTPIAAASSPQQAQTPDYQTKQCADCAEPIRLEAKKCRWCNAWQPGHEAQAQAQSQQQNFRLPPELIEEPASDFVGAGMVIGDEEPPASSSEVAGVPINDKPDYTSQNKAVTPDRFAKKK